MSIQLIKRVVLMACVAGAVGGCGGPPPAKSAESTAEAAAAGEQRISIDNFTYTPATVTVRPGVRVTWVNHDDVPHTVTADDKSFDSKALDTDGSFTHVFASPGTYSYFCAVHPHMTARVIVK